MVVEVSAKQEAIKSAKFTQKQQQQENKKKKRYRVI